jgi:hypothetical protein
MEKNPSGRGGGGGEPVGEGVEVIPTGRGEVGVF